MRFSTLEDIGRKFGVDAKDRVILRSQLRAKMAEVHPDRNGGTFRSETDKQCYFDLQEAMDFLDSQPTQDTAMVPITVVADLVKIVEGIVPKQQIDSAETKLASAISSELADLRVRYRTPKVTTSAIAAALSGIWLFPGQIAEHPILKEYVNIGSNAFAVAWLTSLAITGWTWWATSMYEERQKRLLSLVKTETWQNRQLVRFLSQRFDLDSDGSRHFFKDDFIEYMAFGEFARNRGLSHRPSLSTLLFGLKRSDGPLDPELAQGVADAVLSRAETRGIIAKDPRPSLNERYILQE